MKLISKERRVWFSVRERAIKDLLIFFGVTIGVFLPARMFFYEYVTHHTIPNMGVVTAIAFLMIYLIRRGTLGFVGIAFRRQMQRFMARRTFRQVLIISIIINIYLGFVLFYMERGEFYYEPIRNQVTAVYIYSVLDKANSHELIMNLVDQDEYPTQDAMILVGKMGNNDERLAFASEWLDNGDYALAVTMHESNMVYDGWMSHFGTVFFVEEIETVGLWFLYRKWYYQKTEGHTPWCGFDKNIKKIMFVKSDSLNNLTVSNKTTAKFVLFALSIPTALYILIGLTLLQFSFITLSLFIIFFFVMLPRQVQLKENQMKQFKKFRLLMMGMVMFMMTYIVTQFL